MPRLCRGGPWLAGLPRNWHHLARSGVIASFPLVPMAVHFSTNVNAPEGMKQSKYIQEPQHHADDHDYVQDRLDAAGHGDETIDQPKENSNYDQSYQDLNERHNLLPFRLCCKTLLTWPNDWLRAMSNSSVCTSGTYSARMDMAGSNRVSL